ncbi:alpha/beta-hydrolase [Corynespora cassiicola Philippines]|uniref:Carboxylic ester hydrolase n=1 Tax=Corynespora cassiicola Philippines TaxID=1448308 RepID=A0A2T2P7I6_CORCC|nr:alpha/beta-hydrolase [Corynespora cassiicola Philippines]
MTRCSILTCYCHRFGTYCLSHLLLSLPLAVFSAYCNPLLAYNCLHYTTEGPAACAVSGMNYISTAQCQDNLFIQSIGQAPSRTSWSFNKMRSLSLIPLIALVSASPVVNITNGLIIGNTSNAVDSFYGIPYAEPPIGNLRLRRPQPLSKPLGTFNATVLPRACPQKTLAGDLPILEDFPEVVQAVYSAYLIPLPDVGEDCLTLNVQRPADITADAKLPVLFWIFGGAFESGSTFLSDYGQFIGRANELGEPVIIVAANYRHNTFGFLGGKELKAEGNTNLGLRDQRLALEWVQENIAAFGGDPGRVTIWGQSAGASSVYDHLSINGGNYTSERTGKPLFHAGIMDSGTSFPANPIDSPTAQAQYDFIVSAVSCETTSKFNSSVDCLRSVPYEDLVNATEKISYLYGPEGFHLNYVPRPDDSDVFYTSSNFEPGNPIADVPLIVGFQEDEATVFVATADQVTNDAALVSMLQEQFHDVPRSKLERFVSYYHGDEETGAPFRTNASEEAYPNSKINSAVVSDIFFIFRARGFLASVTELSSHSTYKSPVWAYQASYNHGFPRIGSFHGSSVYLLIFGSFVGTGDFDVPFNNTVGRYSRFAREGIPSSPVGGLQWPKYGEKRELLLFEADGETIISNTFRGESYRYFQKIKGSLNF